MSFSFGIKSLPVATFPLRLQEGEDRASGQGWSNEASGLERGILYLIFLISLALFSATSLSAQTENDINVYIDKVNNGKAEEVKQVLPELITQYQDTPGLIYLQGRLASDGLQASKYYQMVLDNFPKSDWADESLLHL